MNINPNEKSKKDDETKEKSSTTSPYPSFNKIVITDLLENARITNNLASSLSVVMHDDNFLKSYRNLINQQGVLLNTFSTLDLDTLSTPTDIRITDYIDHVILPNAETLTEIGFASLNASKLFEIGSVLTTDIISTQQVSGLLLETLEQQQAWATTLFDTTNLTNNALSFSTALPAFSVISSSLNVMARSLPSSPPEGIIEILDRKDEPPIASKEDTSKHQQLLDEMLTKIDPTFVEFRLGVWVTFNAKNADYIGQASSSMRRLVDNLLRKLAPEEKVSKTKSFNESPTSKDSNGKPTRKARLLFVLNHNEEKASHLERMTDGFLAAYANLSAWDHVPLKKDAFVRGALLVIEGYLISFLSEVVE